MNRPHRIKLFSYCPISTILLSLLLLLYIMGLVSVSTLLPTSMSPHGSSLFAVGFTTTSSYRASFRRYPPPIIDYTFYQIPSTSPIRPSYYFDSNGSHLSLYWGSDDQEPIQGQDRFKACIPYILPFLDLDSFSYHLCHRYTWFSSIHYIFVEPLVHYMMTLPWLSILLFLIFTLGTRSATYLSRSVRFNAQQAALIDVGLVIPVSLGQVFNDIRVPSWLGEVSCNTVYFTFIFVLGYCIWNNVQGNKPNQIPWISDTAELMTGPF